ncbi:MAG: hypothetical protein IJB83_02490 [Bacilli bacterium]|nr:hypothetical protein [Bacilli bacterium]
MTFKEKEEKLSTVFISLTKKCDTCGHSIIFTTKVDMRICSYCGNAVFKDKQTEFKYRVKEKIYKEKKK